jgi:thiamine-phosphate diphosphorylase/hydroxyethylthiazole kinase
VESRGVDSGASSLSLPEKARIVRDLARRERNIVVMTGESDVISDGTRTFAIGNGHPVLGRITGSGCVLGTMMAAALATEVDDRLVAVMSSMLHYEIAAEVAAGRADVKGPGTFVPALIDELDWIRRRTVEGDVGWVGDAKVEVIPSA